VIDLLSWKRAARDARRLSPLLLSCLAVLAAGLLTLPAIAQAQTTLQGRVVRAGAGVPNAAVELHRVGSDTSGMLAAGTAGADGRFAFAVPAADSAAFTVYFATATVDGVRYFGPALHPGDPVPHTRWPCTTRPPRRPRCRRCALPGAT
jgi:hypothetical protein